MSKCHENCVGKQACVQLIRNAEAKAAEKAKADKLATLKGAADVLLNYDLSNKSMPEILEIVELVFEDFIKQRIEAG